MNFNFLDIFGIYICESDDDVNRQKIWWFDWKVLFFWTVLFILPSCCVIFYILGYTTLDEDYKKLVDRYNNYIRLCQQESVAWKPEDDIPCKPGYHVEIVDTYDREDYQRLMQYGRQLRSCCVTNFIKDVIEVSAEEAILKNK